MSIYNDEYCTIILSIRALQFSFVEVESNLNLTYMYNVIVSYPNSKKVKCPPPLKETQFIECEFKENVILLLIIIKITYIKSSCHDSWNLNYDDK